MEFQQENSIFSINQPLLWNFGGSEATFSRIWPGLWNFVEKMATFSINQPLLWNFGGSEALFPDFGLVYGISARKQHFLHKSAAFMEFWRLGGNFFQILAWFMEFQQENSIFSINQPLLWNSDEKMPTWMKAGIFFG